MTATSSSVTMESRITRSEEVLFQEVSGEAVLLDLASEQYFGLNSVGTRIWELLGEHATLQPIVDILAIEFDADPMRIRDDMLTLLTELQVAGLVKAG